MDITDKSDSELMKRSTLSNLKNWEEKKDWKKWVSEARRTVCVTGIPEGGERGWGRKKYLEKYCRPW